MAKKEFTLASGLSVAVYKRRGARNLRLTVAPTGAVRVTIPAWAPYRTGLDFAAAREQWVRSQQKPLQLLRHGQAVGKAHHLEFVAQPAAASVTSRVKQSLVTVSHPPALTFDAQIVQAKAEQACVRALRLQAEQLLPQRLAVLAAANGFNFQKVTIKNMKSRWGSCDQHQNIVLNLFLMQLPWELIDYVLMHELTHTKVLKHGPEFWGMLSSKLPQAKKLRKTLHNYNPLLMGSMA